MRSASRKPRVMASAVGSPLRSSSALVATVVPIFTHRSAPPDRLAPGHAHQLADAGNGRVGILLRILRQQLVRAAGHPGRATMSVKVPPRSIQNCQSMPCLVKL
jgi:hypothetical protein